MRILGELAILCLGIAVVMVAGRGLTPIAPALGGILRALFHPIVLLLLAVERVATVEWRDPVIPEILVPYLVLFFGSIVLMGLPMFRIDRRRWLVTVATTTLLLAAMLYAMAMGVG